MTDATPVPAVPVDGTAPPVVPYTRPRRRWLTWLARFAMMIGGVIVGVLVAEAVFWHRDGGAFPHLNVYRADAELGVRLEPGATQKLAFGGNPITSIRINSDGYRGADLPAPNNEVLVVGDSQVFGLGVEEDQTFSARLGVALAGQGRSGAADAAERGGRTVVNAGVPTYGPGEYRAVVAEMLDRRHPKTVVVAINMVNDLFEASHPNNTRHAVWDGWAVRKESAPTDVTQFPGRDLVFRRSHLFFALRRWWHKNDQIDDRGFASEGTWKDLVAIGQDTSKRHDDQIEKVRDQRDAIESLGDDVARKDGEIDFRLTSMLYDESGNGIVDETAIHAAARANPGDIVSEGNPEAEGSRGVFVTAEMIRRGAALRARLRPKLAAWIKAHDQLEADNVLQTLDERNKAFAELTDADAHRLQLALDPPLAPFVKDLAQLCASHGARLVVVILPIDVQVSADEWKKYGATPIDMAPSKVLIDELAAYTAGLGVSVLDATPVLAAVEPGAFLDKDIHMTPRGHQAVADALAKTIAAPPPNVVVASARSAVPVPAIWREAPEVVVTGSTNSGCETQMVREWLRVLCGRNGTVTADVGDFQPDLSQTVTPTGLTVDKDDGGEALALVMPRSVSVVVPVVEGREFSAQLEYPRYTRRLHVAWPAGAAKPTMTLEPAVKRAHPIHRNSTGDSTFKSPVEKDLCFCWQKTFGGDDECPGAYGIADLRCTTQYKGACARMTECALRDPASPPTGP